MFGRIMKVGMFNQILFKEIVSLTRLCFGNGHSDWGTFPLPGIVKQKAYKFAFQTIFIENRN